MIHLSLSTAVIQQIDAAINGRLSELYRAAKSLEGMALSVNRLHTAYLEAASREINIALYGEPEQADEITAAKAERERREVAPESESELRYAHGDR